jgi:hypothetical protein
LIGCTIRYNKMSRTPATVAPKLPSRLQLHLRALGVLWIIVGALFLIPVFLLLLFTTLGSMVRVSLPVDVLVDGPLVLSIVGALLFIVATGHILLGWGLLKHRPWARMVAIVLGIILLVEPPFGTALGIYTLWVLLSDEGGTEYDGFSRAA